VWIIRQLFSVKSEGNKTVILEPTKLCSWRSYRGNIYLYCLAEKEDRSFLQLQTNGMQGKRYPLQPVQLSNSLSVQYFIKSFSKWTKCRVAIEIMLKNEKQKWQNVCNIICCWIKGLVFHLQPEFILCLVQTVKGNKLIHSFCAHQLKIERLLQIILKLCAWKLFTESFNVYFTKIRRSSENRISLNALILCSNCKNLFSEACWEHSI
jgi:hypothetical protein